MSNIRAWHGGQRRPGRPPSQHVQTKLAPVLLMLKAGACGAAAQQLSQQPDHQEDLTQRIQKHSLKTSIKQHKGTRIKARAVHAAFSYWLWSLALEADVALQEVSLVTRWTIP